ncbi:MAG: acyl carrier protein [Clostridia bacterium]|nr:acyl carrier protein [Clostridia bacterium]
MEDLLKILEEVKPGVDFTKADNLIESGILDSLSIITLVAKISDEFDVEITPIDLVPENFKSAETIYALIQRLED